MSKDYFSKSEDRDQASVVFKAPQVILKQSDEHESLEQSWGAIDLSHREAKKTEGHRTMELIS